MQSASPSQSGDDDHTTAAPRPLAEEPLGAFYDRRVRPFQRRLERAGIKKYLMVAERQKNGRWHLHLASKGFVAHEHMWRLWSPEGFEAYEEAGGHGSGGGFDFVHVTSGPRGRQLSLHKVAGYLCKYMEKEALLEERRGHHLYWQGRGVHGPAIVDGWTRSPEEMLRILSEHVQRDVDGGSMPGVVDYFFDGGDRPCVCGMSPAG